jgi:hypothetical protein
MGSPPLRLPETLNSMLCARAAIAFWPVAIINSPDAYRVAPRSACSRSAPLAHCRRADPSRHQHAARHRLAVG